MIGRNNERKTGWGLRQGEGGDLTSKKFLVVGKGPRFLLQGYLILDFKLSYTVPTIPFPYP